MRPHLILPAIFLAASGSFASAEQPALLLQGGSYEITYRLELPHVERWAIEKRTTICVPGAKGPVPATLPILSDNNPFGECTTVNIRQDGPLLSYDFRCLARDSARAHAAYTVSPAEFSGRIAIVTGAKNMTMTEVQTGHRVGSCDRADALRD